MVGYNKISAVITNTKIAVYSSVGIESTCNAGGPSLISESGRSAGEGIGYPLQYSWASLVAQLLKNPPAMQETWIQFPGWEDPLKKGKTQRSDFHFTSWLKIISVQFSSFQSLSRVRLFATPWIAALQGPLSITNSRSSPKLISIESVMPSSHLILCRPLLLLPPIPPSISLFQWVNSLHHVAKVLEFITYQ